MANDIVRVMDEHEVETAHLVGMSLGGLLAQMAAVKNPERILSLSLISSEPLGRDGRELPHISEKFLSHFSKMSELDWNDAVQVEEFRVEIDRLCSGSKHAFDEPRSREKIQRDIERSPNIASAFNHGSLQSREDWTGSFRKICQPIFVIHGDEDPILPVENGHAISDSSESSTTLILHGVGHEIPSQEIKIISGQIVKFLQSVT